MDVRMYIQSCDVCQRTNSGKFIKSSAPLHPIAVEPQVWKMVTIKCSHHSIVHVCDNQFFNQVGIDIVGPLPITPRGNRYIVTLADYSVF